MKGMSDLQDTGGGWISDLIKEQAICEYCHEDFDGYVVPIEKNCHAFIHGDKLELRANGWQGETKINYCPICGRKL